MAAAMAGTIHSFRAQYSRTVFELFSLLSTQLVGEFSKFKADAKETSIYGLRDILALCLTWQKAQIGGTRNTYKNIAKIHREGVLSVKLKGGELSPVKIKGNNYSAENLTRKHVLIVGGGPAGLYMAILLKTSMPEIHVNIIENRLNEDDHLTRSLTRERVFMFNNAKVEKIKKSDDMFLDFLDLIRTANLDKLLMVSEKEIDFFKNAVNFKEYPTMPINYTELLLAEYAQTIGVKIQHVNYGDSVFETFVRENFLNDNLLVIFDATGGRIYDNFKGVEPKIKPKIAAPPVYEVAVNPDFAVRIFPDTDIPIIGIGDSIVRANYIHGNGLAINGLIMIFYTYIFHYLYGMSFPVESYRISRTRKQRRVAKVKTRKQPRK